MRRASACRAGAPAGHILKDDFDAAHECAQRATQLNPTYKTSWLRLAVAAALLGQQSKAREAADRVLAIDSDFSIQWLRQSHPGFTSARFDRYWDSLRQAGLPE
jgi:hypothetical protein